MVRQSAAGSVARSTCERIGLDLQLSEIFLYRSDPTARLEQHGIRECVDAQSIVGAAGHPGRGDEAGGERGCGRDRKARDQDAGPPGCGGVRSHRARYITAFLQYAGEPAALKRESMGVWVLLYICLLYTSPSPRDRQKSRMPSSA